MLFGRKKKKSKNITSGETQSVEAQKAMCLMLNSAFGGKVVKRDAGNGDSGTAG